MSKNKPNCCTASRGKGKEVKIMFENPSQAISGSGDGMIQLEGGTFLMGTDSDVGFSEDGEGPVRKTQLDPFFIDATAVTNSEFADFVGNTNYKTDAEQFGWSFVFKDFLSDRTLQGDPPSPTDTPWWKGIEKAYWFQPEGQLDNTLILFLSDNGDTSEGGLYGINEDAHVDNYSQWAREGGWSSSYGQGWANLSNTPFRLYKKYTHEGGASAPLVAHWPDRIKDTGSLRHQAGHVIDIMATCADAAGAEYPGLYNGLEIKPLRGQSLLPAFDNSGEGHTRLYWEHEGNRAICHGDWKLVSRHGEPWSLYNLAEDRPELNNRISEKPELVSDLKMDYQQWADNCNVLLQEKVQELRDKRRD